MRVYKDLFTGDEMFCDSYKMKLVDEVVYEVYGKVIIEITVRNPHEDESFSSESSERS
jgi:hypothetical protein